MNRGIFVPYYLQINSEWIPANFAYIQIHFIFLWHKSVNNCLEKSMELQYGHNYFFFPFVVMQYISMFLKARVVWPRQEGFTQKTPQNKI